ncbi:conserved hypothetical protein [Agrobacterium fabrum str. J-07]|nr:conserved hypothetical protein [Agrobacterium fabrum str. J-07]
MSRRPCFRGRATSESLKSLDSDPQPQKLPVIALRPEFQGAVVVINLSRSKKRPAVLSNNEPLLGRLAERPHANSLFAHERQMNERLCPQSRNYP